MDPVGPSWTWLQRGVGFSPSVWPGWRTEQETESRPPCSRCWEWGQNRKWSHVHRAAVDPAPGSRRYSGWPDTRPAPGGGSEFSQPARCSFVSAQLTALSPGRGEPPEPRLGSPGAGPRRLEERAALGSSRLQLHTHRAVVARRGFFWAFRVPPSMLSRQRARTAL